MVFWKNRRGSSKNFKKKILEKFKEKFPPSYLPRRFLKNHRGRFMLPRRFLETVVVTNFLIFFKFHDSFFFNFKFFFQNFSWDTTTVFLTVVVSLASTTVFYSRRGSMGFHDGFWKPCSAPCFWRIFHDGFLKNGHGSSVVESTFYSSVHYELTILFNMSAPCVRIRCVHFTES